MSENNYDLIYIEIKTNKIFHAKRLLFGSYKIREPMSPESEKKITRYELKKLFKYESRISSQSVRKRSQPIIFKTA